MGIAVRAADSCPPVRGEMKGIKMRIASLVDVQHPDLLGRTVVVRVRFAEASDISVVQVEGKPVNAVKMVMVQDRAGHELPLSNLVGNERAAEVWRHLDEGREVDLTAEVTLQNGHYAFTYLGHTEVTAALHLVGATKEEEAAAAKLVDELAAVPQGVIDWIRTEVVDLLGIVGAEGFPQLWRALMAVILQAVANGTVNATPATVNILLVGAPGLGKGLLSRAAVLLNHVAVRISSNSITPAGLIGTRERIGGNRTRVKPGALVLANNGCAIIEDLHNVDTYSYRHAFGIFCDVMEMGRAIRSTYGGVDLQVNTGLLADVNPRSTVRPAFLGKQDVLFLDDLNVTLPYLSRVDVVIYLPRDVARQVETLKAMISDAPKVGAVETSTKDLQRIRRLQVLVAFLRDMCPTVDVEPVVGEVQARLQELLDLNRAKLNALDMASDFLLRGAKSILKLVAASARLHGRCDAESVDVDVAFELFGEKLVFLSLIEPAFRPVAEWHSEPQVRQMRMQEHFSGQTVDIEAICKMFPGVSKRTIQRDLVAIGGKSHGDGQWTVPGPEPIAAGD
ncbi:MAG: hypothetical protein L6R28_13250 [Planctomycetes bacterium]|nr:hypothetical protein [Planctomycetota bacterium]